MKTTKTFFHQDGSYDWLKTIVKTCYVWHEESPLIDSISYVESVAADRAVRLYRKKTKDIGGWHNG